MRTLSKSAIVTCVALLCQANLGLSQAASLDDSHNTANAIQLEHDHPDSWRNFAPELPKALDRVPEFDPETGLHVKEIEPGLFFVTDGIYQSAFLVTPDGIVVFDAPPSLADRLRLTIASVAPEIAITHLVMSHGHTDHVGGTSVFADIPELVVISAAEVSQNLKRRAHPGILLPNKTFEDGLNFTVGGTPIELKTAHYHAEDQDVIIYLPNQKFVMAIDTITPGEAPFMNFGATVDVGAYLASFDNFLTYDFEHFLSGHVSILGTRDDVIKARDYAIDVRDSVIGMMPTFNDRVMTTLGAFEFKNANLAYRHAIETVRDECANAIIDKWQDELSVVDVWAASHCEYTVLYYVMH